MIVDRIENARLYAPLHKQFKKAFALLADPAIAQKPDGRYSVEGDDLYYMVQHYTTKPVDQTRFESHKKYIDIQVLLAGQELLGYVADDGLGSRRAVRRGQGHHVLPRRHDPRPAKCGWSRDCSVSSSRRTPTCPPARSPAQPLSTRWSSKSGCREGILSELAEQSV